MILFQAVGARKLWEVRAVNDKVLLAVMLVVTLVVFRSFGADESDSTSEDTQRVLSTLHRILTNYVNMEFEKMLPLCEGKAKRDIERVLFDVQNHARYSQVRYEISLLSSPTVKEIKVFREENLAVAVVEWSYKRSIPKGTSFEMVNVRREVSYLFRKFGNTWKLISYR